MKVEKLLHIGLILAFLMLISSSAYSKPELASYNVYRAPEGDMTISLYSEGDQESLDCEVEVLKTGNLYRCNEESSIPSVYSEEQLEIESSFSKLNITLIEQDGARESFIRGPIYLGSEDLPLRELNVNRDPRRAINIIVYSSAPRQEVESSLEELKRYLFEAGDLKILDQYKGHFNWYILDGENLCGVNKSYGQDSCPALDASSELISKDFRGDKSQAGVLILKKDKWVKKESWEWPKAIASYASSNFALVANGTVSNEGIRKNIFVEEFFHMVYGFNDEYGNNPANSYFPSSTTEFYPDTINYSKYRNTWRDKNSCHESVERYYDQLKKSDCYRQPQEERAGYIIQNERGTSLMKSKGTTTLYPNHNKRIRYLMNSLNYPLASKGVIQNNIKMPLDSKLEKRIKIGNTASHNVSLQRFDNESAVKIPESIKIEPHKVEKVNLTFKPKFKGKKQVVASYRTDLGYLFNITLDYIAYEEKKLDLRIKNKSKTKEQIKAEVFLEDNEIHSYRLFIFKDNKKIKQISDKRFSLEEPGNYTIEVNKENSSTTHYIPERENLKVKRPVQIKKLDLKIRPKNPVAGEEVVLMPKIEGSDKKTKAEVIIEDKVIETSKTFEKSGEHDITVTKKKEIRENKIVKYIDHRETLVVNDRSLLGKIIHWFKELFS